MPNGSLATHFLQNYFNSHLVSRDGLILEFDTFPLGSDESTVNLNNVSMFQILTWDWTPIRDTDLLTMAEILDRNLALLALLLAPAADLGNYHPVGIAQVPNYNGLADEWEIADVTII
jgi:hypothetical protein